MMSLVIPSIYVLMMIVFGGGGPESFPLGVTMFPDQKNMHCVGGWSKMGWYVWSLNPQCPDIMEEKFWQDSFGHCIRLIMIV